MIPYLDEHPLALSALASARMLYTDLDGTLLGLGGSLLVDAQTRPSLVTADAVVRLNVAKLEVIVCSGRNRIQVAEIARLCGWRGFIAELGCVVVPDRGAEPLFELGDWTPDMLMAGETPFEAIERVGALNALSEAFPGKIENHAPHHLNREATHVLRGDLDLEAASEVLGSLALPVDVVDNGIIHPLATTLRDVSEVHAYHLVPAGVTKAGSIAADIARRGMTPADALAIGDSAVDVQMSDSVALCALTAQSLADARVQAAAEGRGNVAGTRAARGEGWAEFASAWIQARER